MSYTNSDGLFVLTDGEQGAVKQNGGSLGATKFLVVEMPDASTIGSVQVPPTPNDAFIPAGSYITKATLVVQTAWTSAGSATLNIGLYKSNNTAGDADGIDATIALAALAADKAVICNGAQVGGTAALGADNLYVGFRYGTAAFTAGAAKLVIEYIEI